MRWWIAVLSMTAALLALSGITPVYAHWADQAVAEIVVGGSSARVTVTLPTKLLSPAGADPDPVALAAFIEKHLLLSADSAPATARLVALRSPADGILSATHRTLEFDYSWAQPIHALTVRYDLFLTGVPTASCLATIVRDGRVQTFVFTPQNRVVTLGTGWTVFLTRLGSFIVLGIQHIFTGYDHILFLLSLLMLGGTLRGLLKIVSAFTVAHSITLSLAALNVISLPGRWVESAIALSIVVVAAENVLRRDITLRQRWILTFAFGLIHGLGFASILRDLDLPRAALVSSLVGFNIGVELGQIVIVAAAYGALRLLASRLWAPALRLWGSASAAVAGAIWFVQRAFLG